ncbi:hypothetical protein BV898_08925 [Hypsibius exemplaris]|uniref:Uncharacterized protein n=1 Tax=Hypsibius exemplaris TaxID=2072580 RepID=A0A1W0WP19_HYPEX|nr:hypothetical protein BV898_08925 [Hypsibius exemplaris]
MGSYLSIVNDTSDVWQVQIGNDEKAISIATTIATTITVLAMAVSGLGALTPVAGVLEAGGIYTVYGISTATLAQMSAAAATVSGTTATLGKATFASNMVIFIINSAVTQQGFITLTPGQSHTYGPMSLSLWQQAACMRVRVNPANQEECIVETMYMRPIFSGGTVGSTLTHKIQWWIDHWGGKMDDKKVIRRV